MKLGELHCTYCLLEEKTNYVSQLESSLSCTERRTSVSNLTTQSRQHSFVTDRSESDILFEGCKNKTLMNPPLVSNNITIKTDMLKPKNSDSCFVDGDKILDRDYIEDMAISRLTDIIVKTLVNKWKQHEFVKHARTLALFEAQKHKSTDNLNDKIRNCAQSNGSAKTQKDMIMNFLKSIRLDLKLAIKKHINPTKECAV